jgi:hypothetical protein
MLVESGVPPIALLDSVNRDGRMEWQYAPGVGCRRVQLFTRFGAEFARPVYETERLTIRHLQPPQSIDILLAIVHFPSKLHWEDVDQGFECVPLSDDIRAAEERVGHCRTVLVGDLNMSPFENGVVSAAGLHGVMSRQVAQRGSRQVQERNYPFFYNPMWNLMGDETPGPPGSYYYAAARQREFFWHMFDQVLIRPALLDRFDNRRLRILESADRVPLLNAAGLPDREVASDHLPVLFHLAL